MKHKVGREKSLSLFCASHLLVIGWLIYPWDTIGRKLIFFLYEQLSISDSFWLEMGVSCLLPHLNTGTLSGFYLCSAVHSAMVSMSSYIHQSAVSGRQCFCRGLHLFWFLDSLCLFFFIPPWVLKRGFNEYIEFRIECS